MCIYFPVKNFWGILLGILKNVYNFTLELLKLTRKKSNK